MANEFSPETYPRFNPYAKRNTQSRFDPDAFDALIRDQGIRVRHESATLCPCYYGRIESGQQDLECDLCENGYHLFDPVDIFVYIEDTALQKSFDMYGVWDVGTSRMYTPSRTEDGDEFYVGYFDKIVLLDYLEPYSELVARGEGDTDFLQYCAVETRVVRTKSTIYREDIDFRLDALGNIRWVGTNQPGYDQERGIGEAYTVSYLRQPQYRVIDMIHENRNVLTNVRSKKKRPRRLVQECMIKKDYLISKQGEDGSTRGVQEG